MQTKGSGEVPCTRTMGKTILAWRHALHLWRLILEGDRSWQKHLVQTLARRDHREADVRQHLEVNEHWALGIDKLVDDAGQLLHRLAAVGLNVVGLGQLDVVGVDVVCRHDARVEKELLPDVDHLLPAVVHDGHLDGQLVLLDGAQVVERHVEGGIAVDEQHRLLGAGDLCADGGRQAEAHGAERARGDDRTRRRPAKELARHHLVVADASRDDKLVARGVESGVERVDDGLRLELAVWRRREGEGEVALQAVAPLDPLGPRLLLDHRQQHLQRPLGVARHRHRRVDHAAELRRLNVEVDEAAATLLVRLLRLRRVLVEDTGGAVVEARANGNDEVGLLDGVVCVGGAVHAEHVHREVVVLVKDAHRVQRRRHRHVANLGKLHQLVASLNRALADVEDGLLCDGEKARDSLHRGGRGRDWWRLERQRRRRAAQQRGHHVLGQVEVHWTRLT
mmetsp:Transcript_43047/g.94274  ORF Transcript_43047/g.94274 Transcript_43047/m.94274 type:complete len:451 (+) Transcript_43047:549-1901(+)